MDQWLYNISIGCWAAVSELHIVPAAAVPPLSPPYPSPLLCVSGYSFITVFLFVRYTHFCAIGTFSFPSFVGLVVVFNLRRSPATFVADNVTCGCRGGRHPAAFLHEDQLLGQCPQFFLRLAAIKLARKTFRRNLHKYPVLCESISNQLYGPYLARDWAGFVLFRGTGQYCLMTQGMAREMCETKHFARS